MTEIKIEKKKLIWPWFFVAAFIVGTIIYYFSYNNSEKDIAAPKVEEIIENKENNIVVADFISFIESDTNKMSLDHHFVNNALIKLTNAITAMSGEVGYSIKTDLSKVTKIAEMITEDPFETTHADNIRVASDILSKELENLQTGFYPTLTNEMAEVKDASTSIKPDVLALDQKNEIKNFFNKASNLLKIMN
ncbi:MAG: hypothetical protein V1773_14330 [bacterium]